MKTIANVKKLKLHQLLKRFVDLQCEERRLKSVQGEMENLIQKIADAHHKRNLQLLFVQVLLEEKPLKIVKGKMEFLMKKIADAQ
jgi:hypothetical protein